MFENDITFCKSECNIATCKRNVINMKIKEGIHTFASFKGTIECPDRNREVILCGECKHWDRISDSIGRCKTNSNALFRENDYCSYGMIGSS